LKVHRLLYHSTLDSKVIKKREYRAREPNLGFGGEYPRVLCTKAHGIVYHSTLSLTVMKKKGRRFGVPSQRGVRRSRWMAARAGAAAVSGSGLMV
jgi:hypothetical protein